MSDSEEGAIDESAPAPPVAGIRESEPLEEKAESTVEVKAENILVPAEKLPTDQTDKVRAVETSEPTKDGVRTTGDVEMKEAEDPKKEVDSGKRATKQADAAPASNVDTDSVVQENSEEAAESAGDKPGLSHKANGPPGNKSHADQAAEDSATSKDLPYSTRGRTTEKEVSSSGEEKFAALEALEELGRAKDSPGALGVSFLESLSEEERRTRTRFVPDVEGMHILRKHEIKDDLNLARSLVSSSGITSLKRPKAKRTDAMDVDEEGGTSPSDDGSADIVRSGTKLLELPTRDLVVPSNAFVAPPASANDEEGQTTSISALKTENGIKSPLLVDSVSAFDPPRPPESVGPKKKHRMLRWERRPEDVEVDLKNYRKTVQRTRQELQKAEAEYNRLETIDAHLRWNFLNHLNLLNEEYVRLNEDIGSVQQECIKAADLLTSRTRSRGAGKGSYVMRDVLSVLKAKGCENAESMEPGQYPIVENPLARLGIGGLAASSFVDWNRKTKISRKEPASAWTVPGDKVKTPYGEGIVLQVFPPEPAPEKKNVPKEPEKDEAPANEKNSKKGSKGRKKTKKEKKKKESEEPVPENYLCNYLSPRVSVRFSFGIGYFPIDALAPIENPCLFSDAKLAIRWKNMVNTALSVGGIVDVEGMNFSTKERPQGVSGGDADKMDVDATIAPNEGTNEEIAAKIDEVEEDRFMPFGSGLLPTASGRGSLLEKFSITELEKAMEKALYKGSGVLGMKSNQGVTDDFRKWEDEEQEFLTLQASVLQLRNALVRQKRIRLLNERTNVATADRFARSAELVAEMRSDLKSLKRRLEEELKELGMDETVAEQILSSFYSGQESPVDVGERSPLKRSRRSLAPVDEASNPRAYHPYDRESGDDHDLSGDDMDARQVKKLRPNQ